MPSWVLNFTQIFSGWRKAWHNATKHSSFSLVFTVPWFPRNQWQSLLLHVRICHTLGLYVGYIWLTFLSFSLWYFKQNVFLHQYEKPQKEWKRWSLHSYWLNKQIVIVTGRQNSSKAGFTNVVYWYRIWSKSRPLSFTSRNTESKKIYPRWTCFRHNVTPKIGVFPVHKPEEKSDKKPQCHCFWPCCHHHGQHQTPSPSYSAWMLQCWHSTLAGNNIVHSSSNIYMTQAKMWCQNRTKPVEQKHNSRQICSFCSNIFTTTETRNFLQCLVNFAELPANE